MISLALFGISYGIFNTLIFTFLQIIVPDNLRGRTFGTLFTLAGMSFPAGNALAAFSLAAIGLQQTFWIASVAMVISFFWMLPSILKAWGKEPQTAVEEATVANS